MRTIADAFNELLTTKGIGILDLIDNKLDSDAAVTRAEKATYDAEGNEIAKTYAKKSEVMSQSEADNRYYQKSATVEKAKSDSDGNQINTTYAKKSDVITKDYVDDNFFKTSGGTITGALVFNTDKTQIFNAGNRLCIVSNSDSQQLNILIQPEIPAFSFYFDANHSIHIKSDGIYLNETKITN